MSGTSLSSLSLLAGEGFEGDLHYLSPDTYSEPSSESGVSSDGPCSQLFFKLAEEKIRLRRIESELDKARSSPRAAEITKEISARLQETLESTESHFNAALDELACGVELLDQTCIRLASEAMELKEQRLKVVSRLEGQTNLETRLDRIEQFEIASMARLERLEQTLSQRKPIATERMVAEALAQASAAKEEAKELSRRLEDKEHEVRDLKINSFEGCEGQVDNFWKIQQLKARLREVEAEKDDLIWGIKEAEAPKSEVRQGYRRTSDRPPTPFPEALRSEGCRNRWQAMNRPISPVFESSNESQEHFEDIWVGIAKDCLVEPLSVTPLPPPKLARFLAASPPSQSLLQLESRIEEALSELSLDTLDSGEEDFGSSSKDLQCYNGAKVLSSGNGGDNHGKDEVNIDSNNDSEDDSSDDDDGDTGLNDWYVHNLCQKCFDGLCDDCIDKLYDHFVGELCSDCTSGLCEVCADESVEVQDGVSLTGAQLLHLAELGKIGSFKE